MPRETEILRSGLEEIAAATSFIGKPELLPWAMKAVIAIARHTLDEADREAGNRLVRMIVGEPAQ